MNNAGKPRGRPNANRSVKRAKRLDPWLAMERYAENPKFRGFLKAFADQAFNGDILTAEGVHQACVDAGVRISLGTVYNYLDKLEMLKVVKRMYDGRRSWFGLSDNDDRYHELAEIVNRYFK